MNRSWTRPRAAVFALMLLLTPAMLGGCQGLPGQPKIIERKAQYTNLTGHSVAVLVAVSDHTDFNYPDARTRIANEITRRIITEMPDVKVSNPGGLLKWQEDNPYWVTRSPSMLIEALGVERLVLVEIGEYRTHEPGDMHVLRGIITANVNIIEAEAPNPDNYAASYNVSVAYPEMGDSKIGKVGMSEAQVEAQAQIRFCEDAAGLFYDHKVIR